jgi:hypothetical protein
MGRRSNGPALALLVRALLGCCNVGGERKEKFTLTVAQSLRGLRSIRRQRSRAPPYKHAIDRVAEHLTLPDLIEEFRAIRAAVLRRWVGQ